MKNLKTPKIYLILKIIGICLIALGVVLVVVGAIYYVPGMGEDGWFDETTKQSGLIFGGIACLLFGIFITFIGFAPNIEKTRIKTERYVIEENKEDLTDIANSKAEIKKDSVKTYAKAVKDGLKEEETKYCTNCGKKIDKDAKYCPECGAEQ